MALDFWEKNMNLFYKITAGGIGLAVALLTYSLYVGKSTDIAYAGKQCRDLEIEFAASCQEDQSSYPECVVVFNSKAHAAFAGGTGEKFMQCVGGKDRFDKAYKDLKFHVDKNNLKVPLLKSLDEIKNIQTKETKVQ